jgi:hypothetical protein
LRKSKLMPRADGPFKIIEKINDNAYKLKLLLEFGVSLTINISDLRHYLGEEDELESRMTPIQEGEDDKYITLSDTHNPPPLVIKGPITRARVRQLNQQVSSFLCSSACTYENSMLPNEIVDYIVLRNFGEDHEGLGNQQGQGGRLGGRPRQGGGPNHLGVSHLGLQDQHAPNSSPRPQTDSDFSDPHIPGNIKI